MKPGTAKKLANPWSEPWVICADGINDVMVRIRPHPNWSDSQATHVVSIDRLKPYGDRATVRPPTDDADLDMAGDEYVEHIDPHLRRSLILVVRIVVFGFFQKIRYLLKILLILK